MIHLPKARSVLCEKFLSSIARRHLQYLAAGKKPGDHALRETSVFQLALFFCGRGDFICETLNATRKCAFFPLWYSSHAHTPAACGPTVEN
jgi:hypothetical protein